VNGYRGNSQAGIKSFRHNSTLEVECVRQDRCLILCAVCQQSIYKRVRDLRLLVDPVVLGGLPAVELVLLEPESDLLLGVLDGVGTVADVATDVNGEVATDGAGGRGRGVGGTEEGTAGLDGITALPDHGADGARVHVCGLV
jgi:hypothetical protein